MTRRGHQMQPKSKVAVLPLNLDWNRVRFGAFVVILASAFYFYGYYFFFGRLWRALTLGW